MISMNNLVSDQNYITVTVISIMLKLGLSLLGLMLSIISIVPDIQAVQASINLTKGSTKYLDTTGEKTISFLEQIRVRH
jgi:hypothetical protein